MSNIIGVSAFYHESACCLLQDGKLVAAVAEERFTRVKHDARVPVHAYRYCLAEGGLSPADVTCLAYYESPAKKIDRQRQAGAPHHAPEALRWLDPEQPERDIRERFGYEGPMHYVDHHHAHAASAFFYSGFQDAATLTVDGVGEWATTTYGHGTGKYLDLFEEVRFPHSLGLFYATITAYLGFQVNGGEGKVMGLAAYGKPRYVEQLGHLLQPMSAGQFRLDMRYFDFVQGPTMYAEPLCDLLGAPPRLPHEPILPFHEDIACSVQIVLEDMLLEKVRYLATRVDSPNFCLAGGVALNGVANGRLLREAPFERLFVQPAAGDAGACLGAAALAYIHLTGERHSHAPLANVYLGPHAASHEIEQVLVATGIKPRDFRGQEAALLDAVVDRLVQGQVIGWVQGRMEFGPRALGSRSILADPREPAMRERINRLVKKREAFRPFAPSVLAEQAALHFDLDHPTPFMLETCPVTSSLSLPAITHVDGSARPQTVTPASHPRFAALLEAFQARTGCPMLLNTSFNMRGEPIVCTPVDVLIGMAQAKLDALVLEDWLIDREQLPAHWADLLPYWESHPPKAFRDATSPLGENLYTFV